MPKIFICYRREDSAWPAQWIYKNLADHFGPDSVVFDVDTIPLGTDFHSYLNNEVSKCDILLAIIGDQWIDILKQRLDQTNDFVRIEIQAALEREIPVVPVLVGKASVPGENKLPKKLAKLSRIQAAVVRTGPDFEIDLKRLIEGLDHLLVKRKAEEERRRKEAEEAKRKAEEERRKKEAQEAEQKAEEVRKRKEAEEAERQADEERKQKEAEEAERQADEERKQKEAEEAKRQADEKRKLKEKETERKDEIKREPSKRLVNIMIIHQFLTILICIAGWIDAEAVFATPLMIISGVYLIVRGRRESVSVCIVSGSVAICIILLAWILGPLLEMLNEEEARFPYAIAYTVYLIFHLFCARKILRDKNLFR